jgi:hypothetical protein
MAEYISQYAKTVNGFLASAEMQIDPTLTTIT